MPGLFAGLVPAAGASTRMGRSKALLELEGESFVYRAVTALRKGGCEPVFVVSRLDDEEVREQATRAAAATLINHDPGEGPITSLRLALARLSPEAEGIAYLPVDHPLVRPETVGLLIREAQASGASLTVPMRGEKRGHPALFRRTLFAELVDPTLEGGARTVVHRHLSEARLVQVDDPGVTADIDTPADYDAVAGGGS